MQKIKLWAKDGSVKEIEARTLLNEVNDCEGIATLQALNWQNGGKVDLLMGKSNGFMFDIAEPLSQAEAEQAVKEYYENK